MRDERAQRFGQSLAVEDGRRALTVAGYVRAADRFLRTGTMSRAGVRDYLAQYRGAATRRWQLAVIRRLCAWLVAEGEIDADPTAGLRGPAIPARSVKALTVEDDAALLAVTDRRRDERSLLVLLMRRSGLRIGEILGRPGGEPPGVRLGDLDLTGGRLRVVGKGGRTETAYLHGDTVTRLGAQITRLVDQRPEAALFQSRAGRRWSVRWGQRALAQIAREAQVRGRITPHMLRHTFATRFLEHGGDIRAVQRLLRHQRLSTTTIYADYSDVALRRAFEQHAGREVPANPPEPSGGHEHVRRPRGPGVGDS